MKKPYLMYKKHITCMAVGCKYVHIYIHIYFHVKVTLGTVSDITTKTFHTGVSKIICQIYCV